jgi:hypothetical protein
MPRKFTKDASAPASRSSSKRPAQDTPTRQSKRARASARKSYVEPDSDDDEQSVKKSPAPSNEDEVSEASDFDEAGDVEPSSESELEDAPSSDEEVKPKKSGGKKSLPFHSKKGKEEELWKSGAKLAPGTQVIIKKPKARDAGDTPYTDGTLHSNTMLFLKDLAKNNDRTWLKCKLRHPSHMQSTVSLLLPSIDASTSAAMVGLCTRKPRITL